MPLFISRLRELFPDIQATELVHALSRLYGLGVVHIYRIANEGAIMDEYKKGARRSGVLHQ
jgi:hypothetical protein